MRFAGFFLVWAAVSSCGRQTNAGENLERLFSMPWKHKHEKTAPKDALCQAAPSVADKEYVALHHRSPCGTSDSGHFLPSCRSTIQFDHDGRVFISSEGSDLVDVRRYQQNAACLTIEAAVTGWVSASEGASLLVSRSGDMLSDLNGNALYEQIVPALGACESGDFPGND